jgi:prenyltransferase beta subunit
VCLTSSITRESLLSLVPPPREGGAHRNSCKPPEGGYGGGPGQMAHLAPTYAAVSALLTLGGEEALGSINR